LNTVGSYPFLFRSIVVTALDLLPEMDRPPTSSVAARLVVVVLPGRRAPKSQH